MAFEALKDSLNRFVELMVKGVEMPELGFDDSVK